MIRCNSLCSVIAIPKLLSNPYRDGDAKYCQECEKFLPAYWNYCVCCTGKLRVRRRQNVTVERRYLEQFEYKICATMSA